MDTGFIYIWKDTYRNMFYIGSHFGEPTDGYISSSKWLNYEYNFRPQHFRRKILKIVPVKDLIIEEYKLLSMIKSDEFGRKYYNLKAGAPKGVTPWNKGTAMWDDAEKERIAEQKKGKAAWNKGVPNPLAAENARKGAAKLSEKVKGRKRLYKEDGSWTWYYPDSTQQVQRKPDDLHHSPSLEEQTC